MELKNKKYKYINNTKRLPGFVDGLTPWQMYQLGSDAEKQHFRDAVSGSVVPINNSHTSNPITKSTLQTNPQVSSGSGMNWGNIGGAITSTVGFAGDTVKAFTHYYNADEELMNAGQSEGSVDGISYTRQNRVDRDEVERQIKKQNIQTTTGLMAGGAAAGAGIGSLFPGAGTAIGAGVGALAGLGVGLFAGNKNRIARIRAVREAEIRAGRINNFNRSGAFTTAMQQDYAKTYGDSRSQSLYGASGGKEPEVNPITNETIKDFNVETVDGKKKDKQNSWVEQGEYIWRQAKTDGFGNEIEPEKLHYVNHGPNDGARANLKSEDGVFTNKWGIADQVPLYASQGRLPELMQKQQILTGMERNAHNMKHNMKIFKAKCGKLPEFYEGWVPNAITSGLGFVGGLSQYLEASGQEPKRPNTYASNKYESRALNDLYSLQVNPYPIIPELYNQYAKTMAAIDRSGGLGGGQRALARMAAMNNTQLNTAKLLAGAQEQNNAYKAQSANASLNAGNADAQRRMQSNQWDLDYYSKAHAARQQGMQMGIYNMMNQLQQYYANDFKRRQFNDTMDLYRQQLDLDKQRLLHDLYGSEPTSKPWTMNPNLSIKQEQDLFDADMRSHQQQFERDMKSRGFYYVPERANAIQRLAHDMYQRDQQSKNPNKKEIPVPDFSIINNLVQQRIKNSRNKRK